ncbi:MAG TPA: PAS domain S-box protein [Sandaracinaceae bacterium LLY-WYZ-13_1]|nr:PAS domain S-box protein [Sandaracinaceae bacterium LLY-WYZ-13_1]
MPPPELATVVQALAHPVAVVRDGRVLLANDALAELLGRDPTGEHLDAIELPPSTERREASIGDGRVLCSFLPAPSEPAPLDAWLSRISDETASTLLLAHRHDPISLIDPATDRFVDVSEAWCAQYGYRREEVVGRLGPADVSAEPEKTRQGVAARARDEPADEGVIRWHRREDGSVFPVELQCGPLEIDDADGPRTLVYARPRDVEERLRAEEALRQSEARYRALIEQLPHAVIVHRDERLLYLNPAARELLGFDADEDVVGIDAARLVHPDDREAARARVRDYVMRDRPAPLREERFVRRDGSTVTVEVVGIPAELDGAPAALSIAQDVTAERAMEERLEISDRLASLGRLAASVGHEINNPLAYLIGSLEVIRRETPAMGAPAREKVERALDAAEHGALRVRDIVRELEALSRSDPEATGPSDLGRILDSCVQMASHELKHRARVRRDYARGVWVAGSEARLGQVFLNLLVNAAQAIDEGARSQHEVRIVARVENGEAVVEVSDTGRGLPETDVARLFEPFYTTKRGRGTGLGLSICHHVVRSLGGTIEAERRAPRGSVFRVRLPAGEPVTRPSEAPDVSVEIALPIGRRALVVEDEPPIRELLEQWLADTGLEVVGARSGREALARLEGEGPFDVVVCDLMMDDLTGMDLHERLARTAPSLADRMIFVTGGAFTDRAEAFVAAHRARCLNKPFRRSAILSRVSEVLSSRASDAVPDAGE